MFFMTLQQLQKLRRDGVKITNPELGLDEAATEAHSKELYASNYGIRAVFRKLFYPRYSQLQQWLVMVYHKISPYGKGVQNNTCHKNADPICRP
jgi:hypothetical protein